MRLLNVVRCSALRQRHGLIFLQSERILRELNAVGSQEFRRSVDHGVVLHERDARYVLRRASPSGIKADDCAVA